MQNHLNIQLILDTHVFLWLMNDENELSLEARKIIETSIIDGSIAISAISLWEISMLHARERILLNQPCLTWIKRSLEAPGITLYPLTPEITVESASLPGGFHGDSADRFIVATARVLGIPLLTREQKIIDYGKDDYLHCIKA
ncbi:MAG: type II toxin-antitoxin system VapC family toxin [Candidatus Paracaedimonas acanthamoebae]|uniref:Type II toxin-antitoxin system VapC family toxin n=1 Tax=Candidatus Paracaedimonas acanthamoebae TaxID=244581 RepID=A0A8J7PQZ0_9PROT|nr:type II toxin-antitoxin system VapC family toxin [Candidatus Paracaedimonas acanthamoebae]